MPCAYGSRGNPGRSVYLGASGQFYARIVPGGYSHATVCSLLTNLFKSCQPLPLKPQIFLLYPAFKTDIYIPDPWALANIIRHSLSPRTRRCHQADAGADHQDQYRQPPLHGLISGTFHIPSPAAKKINSASSWLFLRLKAYFSVLAYWSE